MFCPKCGTDVGQSKFCPNCGTKLSGENNGNGFVNQVQAKINDATQGFKAQEPKKQKIMIISAVLVVALVVVLLFVFAGGGTGSGVKEQLCDGVWCKQYQFESPSFSTVDFGPWLDTNIYEFKPDNTFTEYYGTYYFSDIASLLNVPMKESFSGKYSIDEEKCQIILTSSDGETVEIPYAINEYTHELLFDVNTSGESIYWNVESLEDAMFYYDHEH